MQTLIELFHADSLGGPMGELKKAFEAKNPAVEINLTSGRSKELAERILNGDVCDVFAPSDPQVVNNMIGKKVCDKDAASWYVAFSANELVVITKKGNPFVIKHMTDLAKDEVILARVSGETDMGTNRTIEFIHDATAEEGNPVLGQQIIDRAIMAGSVPGVLQAVQSGKANAGIVYLSAAVSIAGDVDIIYFSAAVNLSKKIVNVVTIPGTAKNVNAAGSFIKLLLSPEGREILKRTGQPPIVPPLTEGDIPLDMPVQ